MIRSTMQPAPLQLRRLFDHGARIHAHSEVVTATGGALRRARFEDIARNAGRLANALAALGVGAGDRVATFMWNNQEHVEAYWAVPCMGAVLHPLNIRLAGEQIVYIANHAADQVVIVDATLVPLFAKLLPAMTTVRHVIVVGAGDRAPLDGARVPVHDWATLLDAQPARYDWPAVDEETAAAMCYTSGTTGNPKGVVYSHRSIYLHSLGMSLPDLFNLSARDLVLGIVPQFHVLAWGLPYAAFLTGASLAMPDRFLAPEPLAAFIAAARPNKGAGVPTVWTGLLQYLETHPEADISSLKEAIVGGSAMPRALYEAFEARHGIALVHAWGMTEMSPLGTMARPPAGCDDEEALRHRLSQGRFAASVEARLIGGDGSELLWDGEQVGELEVRGPWITATYYGDDDPEKFRDGWLRTGDVGTISARGYLTLTDRAKDVIKSGGEWISSVALEGTLLGHPAVAEAAVIGVPDEKWGERPLAAVVLRGGQAASPAELRAFLSALVPRWQVPERWAFVVEIPKTSVGKIDKKMLRLMHGEGRLDVVVAGDDERR